MTKKQETLSYWNRAMDNYGISMDDRFALRRIEMTLQRWSEQECGNSDDYKSWTIERDETTNKPFMVIRPHKGETRKYSIADRETGALKRLSKIAKSYPSLSFYHQGDPRGCSLYIVRNLDIPKGESIDAFYTRGICANY